MDKDILDIYTKKSTLVNPDIGELPLKMFPHVIYYLHDSFKRELSDGYLLFPNFSDDKNIFCFTDFGGDHPESKYITFSFFFVGQASAFRFLEAMKPIREQHKMHSNNEHKIPKEYAFKSFGFGPINRSLKGYLTLANNTLNGFIYTLAIDKNVELAEALGLIYEGENAYGDFEKVGFDAWKTKQLTKAYAVTNILSYFAKLFLRGGNGLYWMCDHDEILANDAQKEQLAKMFGHVLNAYIDFSPNPFSYSTPFGDSIFLKDILSLCDISSGCIEESLTNKKNHGEKYKIKSLSNYWISLMCEQGISLKRYAGLLMKDSQGYPYISRLKFSPKDSSVSDFETCIVYISQNK